tara:strand:+ start:2633 stop:3415 length:783 start_codon:yes stop_codon:yes gene_type:complete
VIISVISGGFDPLHSGHIEYIKSAKKLGKKLVVALNSDEWLIRKKGKYFLPFSERKNILESITFVDEVINFEDDDLGSCKNALEALKEKYPNDKIIFCNGGDRNDSNIPEQDVKGIEFEFSVGGDDKKNSSSDILKDWSFPKEKRLWGEFYELYSNKNLKVKELVVLPKQGMSFQRHLHRNELWFISEGSCIVNYSKSQESEKKEYRLSTEDIFQVKKNEWHQIINPNNEVCKIIEIQYGEEVEESDIERLYYYDENKNL